MSADVLWHALALMLIVEGILPFFSPNGWRDMFKKMLDMSQGQIRFFGLCSMVLGAAWLTFLAW